MNSDVCISVLIPVYNAETYVENAVTSAVNQREVGEIILVDDGSRDCSYEICRRLEERYTNVHVFTHEKHANLGPSATRNLALNKANFNIVGFLDADDYYLPNRFSRDIEILKKNSHVDGVYNAIGFHFYGEGVGDNAIARRKARLTTVRGRVSPEELFYVLTNVHPVKGYFHLDGLTIKKKCLEKLGGFNCALRLHQDTDIAIKLAAICRLYSGEIDQPVGVRGLHLNNRITNNKDPSGSRYRLATSLREWMRDAKITGLQAEVLENYCLSYELGEMSVRSALILSVARSFRSRMFFSQSTFFSKLIRRIIGDNQTASVIVKIKSKVQKGVFRGNSKHLSIFNRPGGAPDEKNITGRSSISP